MVRTLPSSVARHAPPALTPRQVREFHEVGYVIVPGVFSEVELERMRAGFFRLQQMAYRMGGTRMHRGSQFVLRGRDAGGGNTLRIERIVWCGAAEPVLDEYGKDLRLLRMVGRLLGSRSANQLICQAHFKLPGDTVEFPWHQDSRHRRFGRGEWRDVNGRGSYVQTVVAIDDMGPDNGPLSFIPGSCRHGHLEPDPHGQLPEGTFDPAQAVPGIVKAGGVILFGPYTVHGSVANNSTRPRRVLINGFAYPGANSRIYPGDGAGRLVRIPN